MQNSFTNPISCQSNIRSTFRLRIAQIFDLSDAQGRIKSMEGLRGVAILIVFLCHFDVLIVKNLSVQHFFSVTSATIGRVGTAGVDLFFVLSGFLIYRAALRPNLRYFDFISRRMRRIYPAFLVVLAFYIVVSYLMPSLSKIPAEPTAAAGFLLMNLLFLPGFVNVNPIVSVAWSLSYEWYFYLSLPLFIQGFKLYSWSPRWRIIFFVTLPLVYISFSLMAPTIGAILSWPIERTHVRLVMFVCGMLISELIEVPKFVDRVKNNNCAILVICIIGLLSLFVLEFTCLDWQLQPELIPFWFEPTRTTLLFISCVFLTLSAFSGNGFLTRIFSTSFLRGLGNISYSFYLVHTIPLNIMKMFIVKTGLGTSFPILTYTLCLPIAFVAAISAALLMYLLIEKPFSLHRSKSKANVGHAAC
ncbi:MAG: acyltransferase [Methylococcales bacterium]